MSSPLANSCARTSGSNPSNSPARTLGSNPPNSPARTLGSGPIRQELNITTVRARRHNRLDNQRKAIENHHCQSLQPADPSQLHENVLPQEIQAISDSVENATNDDNDHSRGYSYSMSYFDSFPVGYRFTPTDQELIVHYLQKQVMKQPLPPHKIRNINIYRYNPEDICVRKKGNREESFYFFTPRDKKYPNGTRPSRAAGDGYWKATGADKRIKVGGVEVGAKKSLVFYRGKPPHGAKTDWIMHEYRVSDPPPSNRAANDMRLDDSVLCRLQHKPRKSKHKEKEKEKEKLEDACERNVESENQITCQLHVIPTIIDEEITVPIESFKLDGIPTIRNEEITVPIQSMPTISDEGCQALTFNFGKCLEIDQHPFCTFESNYLTDEVSSEDDAWNFESQLQHGFFYLDGTSLNNVTDQPSMDLN